MGGAGMSGQGWRCSELQTPGLGTPGRQGWEKMGGAHWESHPQPHPLATPRGPRQG